jgi:L,D-transpeptidase catalytic domain
MRYLVATLLALISAPTWANELDSLLQQAQVLGAPMTAVQRAIQDLAPADLSKKDVDSLLQQARVLGAPVAAVQRAIQISRQPIFPKKDVLAVFDISQPSSKKRFYVLDFKSGQVTAHYAAHGKDNGPSAKAIKFKGFQTDLDMVPLGPLKTTHSEVMDNYKTIVDRYDGTVYPDMIVVVLEGVTSYNSYINHTPPFKWIIHPNWYTTAGFRAKNGGTLGRSGGCVVVDPVENNKIVTRLQDGALVYVTVGDAPIEQYL